MVVGGLEMFNHILPSFWVLNKFKIDTESQVSIMGQYLSY